MFLLASGSMPSLFLGPGPLAGGLPGLAHWAKEVIPNALGELDELAPRQLVNMGEGGELALDLLESLRLHVRGDGRMLPRLGADGLVRPCEP